MRVVLHPKYGHIMGGNCDHAHQDRRARERGGKSAITWLKDAGALRHVNGGWWRFTKRKTKAERAFTWREKEEYVGGGAETKIGFYRVFQDLTPMFRKRSKAFRLSFLLKCVEDLEGFEFNMTGGYQAPHQDGIYQARKADGDLGSD